MRALLSLLAVLLVGWLAACADAPTGIQISLDPSQHTLAPLETHTFTATVTGTPNTVVTWHATAGTVTGSGPTVDFTAPASPGAVELTATSVADPAKKATAAITVVAPQPPPGTTKLLASDGAAGDQFGTDVAIDGDVLVVGAPGNDAAGPDSGAAYVFVRAGSAWQQQARLAAPAAASGAMFGRSVAISGDTAVVADAAQPRSAVYVFTQAGDAWSFQQKLVPAAGSHQDGFGRALAVEGDTLLVGADRDDTAALDAGAAYVYTRSGGTWTEQARLVAPDGAFNERFGYAVELAGATAAIGAYGSEGLGPLTGFAYVFVEDAGTWSEQQKLTTMPYVDGDYFGHDVGLDGDALAVGARLDDGVEKDSGSVHLFARAGSTWTRQTRLTASDAAADGEFGYKVALDAGTLVASRLAAPATVYVFREASGAWTETERHSRPFGAFGNALALSGPTLVVGAFQDAEAGDDAGAAYVFEVQP